LRVRVFDFLFGDFLDTVDSQIGAVDVFVNNAEIIPLSRD
jgi:hypothetical protein